MADLSNFKPYYKSLKLTAKFGLNPEVAFFDIYESSGTGNQGIIPTFLALVGYDGL